VAAAIAGPIWKKSKVGGKPGPTVYVVWANNVGNRNPHKIIIEKSLIEPPVYL